MINGLRKLEYRGYDSSGLGIICGDEIQVRKAPGKIGKLQELMKTDVMSLGTVGISHTRWATHGAPNQVNSHPHFDCSKKILIVHNGIIENYEELRTALEKRGHKFLSETDTEVVAHLIEENLNGDFLTAVRKSFRQLTGAFALGIICTDHPDTLIAARIGSPLIIGLGEKENYIASDVPAILDLTKKIIYLKDGEMAVITKDNVAVSDFNGKKVTPKVDTVKFSAEAVQKQGSITLCSKKC